MSDSCGCIYVGDDCGPEVYNSIIYVARKEHKCTECGRTIQSGEKYEYVFGVWSGIFDEYRIYKTCSDCISIREAFYCDNFSHTDMIAQVRGHILGLEGNISEDCLLKLTKPARDIVCKMIEKVWEDLEG